MVCLGEWKTILWQSPGVALGASKTYGCSLFSRLISSSEETVTGCTNEGALLQVPTLLLARCQQLSWYFSYLASGQKYEQWEVKQYAKGIT